MPATATATATATTAQTLRTRKRADILSLGSLASALVLAAWMASPALGRPYV